LDQEATELIAVGDGLLGREGLQVSGLLDAVEQAHVESVQSTSDPESAGVRSWRAFPRGNRGRRRHARAFVVGPAATPCPLPATNWRPRSRGFSRSTRRSV